MLINNNKNFYIDLIIKIYFKNTVIKKDLRFFLSGRIQTAINSGRTTKMIYLGLNMLTTNLQFGCIYIQY